jgi:hypothetical protein
VSYCTSADARVRCVLCTCCVNTVVCSLLLVAYELRRALALIVCACVVWGCVGYTLFVCKVCAGVQAESCYWCGYHGGTTCLFGVGVGNTTGKGGACLHVFQACACLVKSVSAAPSAILQTGLCQACMPCNGRLWTRMKAAVATVTS